MGGRLADNWRVAAGAATAPIGHGGFCCRRYGWATQLARRAERLLGQGVLPDLPRRQLMPQEMTGQRAVISNPCPHSLTLPILDILG